MHLIQELTVDTKKPEVQGQVVRLWYEPSNQVDGRDLRLLLTDESGDSIEIRAYGFVADMFGSKFKQYHWYSISRILVVPKDEKLESAVCPLTTIPRRILMTSETLVRDLYRSNEISEKYIPFGEINASMVANESRIVHLMGCVFDIGLFNGEEIDFYIEDVSGTIFKCVAKGSCAFRFMHIRDAYEDDVVVCCLRFFRAVKSQAGDVTIVADSGVSEVLVNPFIKEAIDLRERIRAWIRSYMA